MAVAAVAVKFLRHLSAVMLVVTVVVGLGMLWAHASGGGGGFGRADLGGGFQLARAGDLIRTCVIEAVLAAIVITVSAIRRRHRRMRRSAATSARR